MDVEFDAASPERFGIGDTVKISDVTLPAGTAPTITDRDFMIANISAPTALAAEEEEEGEELEGEEGLEGEDAEGAEGEASAEGEAPAEE